MTPISRGARCGRQLDRYCGRVRTDLARVIPHQAALGKDVRTACVSRDCFADDLFRVPYPGEISSGVVKTRIHFRGAKRLNNEHL